MTVERARRRPSTLLRALVFAGIGVTLFLYLFGSILFPGNSALYQAIDRGDGDEVRRLLGSGADPNSRSRAFLETRRSSRYAAPPLVHAVWRNQPGIAVMLLEAGADPDGRHDNGETALNMAAMAGHNAVVRALIEKGADVNASVGGATALRHGPYFDRRVKALKPEIERMLRDAGAR